MTEIVRYFGAIHIATCLKGRLGQLRQDLIAKTAWGRDPFARQFKVLEDLEGINHVRRDLSKTVLNTLQSDYPGLTYDLEGEEKERKESLGSLLKGFIMAQFLIYCLLAVPFRSYLQPFIIMSAIPFGFVGAVLGHLVLGFNLSILSMFGLVALTGVVVNDSLLLVNFANEKRRAGVELHEAVILAAQRRFRPIVLTSLTTSLGLTPIIIEKSMQAQFLIPMAVSLGFGVLFATLVTLLLVPSIYLILEDLLRPFKRGSQGIEEI